MKIKSDAEVKFKVILDGNEAEENINRLSKKADGLNGKLSSVSKKMTIGVTTPIVDITAA